MNNTRRMVFILVLLGVGIGAFSLLGTAKLTGSNGNDSSDPGKNGVKDTSRGVVCLGTADIDVDQIAVYPDNFPPINYPIKILTVKKKEGDKVAKGEVIAILDDTIPKMMVEKAELRVQSAKIQQTQAKQKVETHSFAIKVQQETIEAKQAEIHAKNIELVPYKKEADKVGGYKADEYAARAEGVKALEKSLEIEKTRLDALKQIQPTSMVDLAATELSHAETDLELAKKVASQAVFLSPVDGTIHRTSLYDGMILGPQMRKEPVIIQPNGKLFIRAEVNQEYANRVVLNQKATIVDYSNTNLIWKGKITKIADHFSQKRSNNTSGVELFSSGDDPILEVTIELEDVKNPIIRQGQRVRVNIGTE